MRGGRRLHVPYGARGGHATGAGRRPGLRHARCGPWQTPRSEWWFWSIVQRGNGRQRRSTAAWTKNRGSEKGAEYPPRLRAIWAMHARGAAVAYLLNRFHRGGERKNGKEALQLQGQGEPGRGEEDEAEDRACEALGPHPGAQRAQQVSQQGMSGDESREGHVRRRRREVGARGMRHWLPRRSRWPRRDIATGKGRQRRVWPWGDASGAWAPALQLRASKKCAKIAPAVLRLH